MRADARAALDAEPVPVAPSGAPARACVTMVDGAWRTAWLIGVTKEPFGLPYATARAAAAASHYLNDRAGG